jgi:hypothetical protein
MSAGEEASAVRLMGLTALATIASGVISGAAYSLTTMTLAAFATPHLPGWWMIPIIGGCAALLGFSIGHTRPQASIASAFVSSLIGAALFALVLALPGFTSYGRNVIGLVNFALTQSAFAFFIILIIAFPAAMAGLLGNYFWEDR